MKGEEGEGRGEEKGSFFVVVDFCSLSLRLLVLKREDKKEKGIFFV